MRSKKDQSDVFQLKADFLPITILQLTQNNLPAIKKQLENITQKAPNYFANAPMMVDFTQLQDSSDKPDIEAMCALLREYHMQPIAARGIPVNVMLPVIPDRTDKKPAPQKTADSRDAIHRASETMVITKPIRAGTQIYAKDGDLIVLSSVNAGAEVIADGHIHIYGPLRGRALAGANGNTDARIFCQTLEAELIAIAGHYLVNEKIKMPKSKSGMLQIFLENEKLQVESI